MADGALSGIKVLDLTHYIAGPFCTKFFSDFGADVLKVERPGTGDGARRTGPFFHDEPHHEKSALFLFLNTNKKSMTLNLKTEAGATIIKEMVKEADVLVENFRPGFMDSVGLGYDVLEKINPRLVMTSISNFGQTGPYRDYKATDMVEYALSGLMYVIGDYDREPLRQGGTPAQYTTGETAAISTFMALSFQEETGGGDHLDISILDSMVAPQFTALTPYIFSGGVMRRQPKIGGKFNGNNAMATQNGYVIPVVMGNMEWTMFALSVDLLDELDNEKFDTPAARVENSAELDEILLKQFQNKTKEELFHETQSYGSAFGLVMSSEDLVNCPHLNERGFFVEIDHPATGPLTYPGAPFKLSDTPWAAGRAPLLGEHNKEVFVDKLGYSLEDMDRLSEAGII
ncbi:MAG: CoA transferase [Dehalococcoidia bacterium]|nr:CoA transferase [Dehalococcoidia bacterium]